MVLMSKIFRNLAWEVESPDLSNNINKVLQSPTRRQQFLNGESGKIAGLSLVEYDFSNIIYGIKTPTIIIWGEQDRTTSVSGTKAAVSSPNGSELLFSASKIQSPYNQGFIHGFYEVTDKHPL